MKQDFPEVIKEVYVGRTYKGKKIRGYIFFKGGNSQRSFKSQVKARPGIFINGAHHPRELTSISMNVYIMLKLLHATVQKKPILSDLISKKVSIFFVPVVNQDGYEEIARHFTATGKLIYIRKNRHDISRGLARCTGANQDIGVDLNRNYDYKFRGEGSSNDPCAVETHGPYPFSEPET
jgi:murein tripeptide amidase MpaA